MRTRAGGRWSFLITSLPPKRWIKYYPQASPWAHTTPWLTRFKQLSRLRPATNPFPLSKTAIQDRLVSLQPLAIKARFMSNLALVLDIDGTCLSDDACPTHITKQHLRPGLQDFLDWAFGTCLAVGIWTAASGGWAETFCSVLAEADRERGEGGGRPWAFVWNGARVTLRAQTRGELGCYGGGLGSNRLVTKRLRKIWNNSGLRALGYERHCTLIVDDTPSVCSDNFGNAVYVPTYCGEAEDDDVLVRLRGYLESVNSRIKAGGSVRALEKRQWLVEVETKL